MQQIHMRLHMRTCSEAHHPQLVTLLDAILRVSRALSAYIPCEAAASSHTCKSSHWMLA